MSESYKGKCFCGSVEFTASGAPVGMGYCHCTSCRQWSAAPVNAFTLWAPDSVRVTKGAANIGVFHLTDRSYRKWCTKCGGHLFTEHPMWKLVDVYAASLPTLAFKPGLHVNYQETVLPMRDGLPKQRDFPKEMGGTGELLAE
jgi:hypothetical protein